MLGLARRELRRKSFRAICRFGGLFACNTQRGLNYNRHETALLLHWTQNRVFITAE